MDETERKASETDETESNASDTDRTEYDASERDEMQSGSSAAESDELEESTSSESDEEAYVKKPRSSAKMFRNENRKRPFSYANNDGTHAGAKMMRGTQNPIKWQKWCHLVVQH
jgi:hypothetical protein